ncbi:thioesterase [Jeongeupia sp. HS-3]|uniref:YiiD C-terminal domain-containing protein n=1 Tax=Jeongeupia sp. HS-3 TaxID=1009682 RepID=UPI0018A4FB57|nr:YiiD C-terminal domain-containing protein [Jeongeupia sp. HS-3]BCL74380.1 thioesterase [Jeongeupia sp. HS-3]
MSDFADRWTQRLHSGFPLLAAMDVRLVGDARAWQLHAPFDPNRNDHGTAFGGSLSTLATIAGWLYVSVLAGDAFDVVIQSGNAHFVQPLQTGLVSQVTAVSDDELVRFRQTLARRGRARLTVHASVGDGTSEAMRFTGQYVAVRLPG